VHSHPFGPIAPDIGIAGEPPVPAARRRRRLPARLRQVYEHVVFYGLLAIFGLTSLLWSLPAALLYRLLPKTLGEPLGQFMIMALSRYFVGAMRLTGIIECDLGALDALRRSSSLVIAPNHPSLLDAVLVISRVPHVACAAKAEIWDNILLGGAARLAGFIRNDSPTRLIRQAARQLRAGQHFLIFPEGTRSSGTPVGDFKGGFALIAKKAVAPVQTVFIDSNSPFLGKGWPLLRKPEFPLIYRARLGRRFRAVGDTHAFVRQLQDYYRQELSGAPR
jgi:1-acyl-sn-glycerol-3-phosphate acyltransferase